MSKKLLVKKLIVISMIFTLAISMVACEKKGNTDNKGEEIYKVAMEPTFPPFDTTDPSNPEKLAGFDVDLMEAIAKNQGFKLEWSNMNFQGLIPAIQSGNIDIIASGMNASEERRKQVTFSETYYDSGLVVAVKSGNDKIKSIDDLSKNMKVGAQIGTTGGELCQKLKSENKIKEAKIYDGLDVAVMDLKNNNIDALINDLPVTKEYMNAKPGTITIVGDVLNAESFGFAVKKGNEELINKINQGIKNLKENGEFDKIYSKWFEN